MPDIDVLLLMGSASDWKHLEGAVAVLDELGLKRPLERGMKCLDPACGSGAFPMGVLQKLVYIIHKLDPINAKWMQLQIELHVL